MLKTEMKKVQSAVELVGDGVKEIHVDVKEGRDELKIMLEEVHSFQTTLATIGDQVRVHLDKRVRDRDPHASHARRLGMHS